MDGTRENDSLILRSDNGGVAVLTLNAPKSMNALSEAMLAAISQVLDEIAADRSVKAVILRSGGNHFCAGHNLKEMTARRADDDGGFQYFQDLFAKCSAMMLRVVRLTEVYGPAVVCAEKPGWAALPPEQQADLRARQGVAYELEEDVLVLDPETGTPVPWDGETLGEVAFRGNIVMKGYLKAPEETAKAFKDGWFWSGDIAVQQADGYIEIRDRSKDVLISGGENISSIEVEKALYSHPAISLVAVVAMPDEKWGEVPCAFVELSGAATEEDLVAYARARLAGYLRPKKAIFGELPKTTTGKIRKNELRDLVRQNS